MTKPNPLFLESQDLVSAHSLVLPLLLALILVLQGCAKPSQPTESPSTSDDQRWQAYLGRTGNTEPYRISLSLRIGHKGDTRRVTALLWGNTTHQLRLDVMAGVGTTIAKLQASPEDFLLVAPVDGKAYTHSGSAQPRLKLGVPIPLTLTNLADLLNGNDLRVFGTHFLSASPRSGGLVRYQLTDTLPGFLDLDLLGYAVVWQEHESGTGWTMRLEREADGSVRKIDLSNHKGERLLVLVKEREKTTPFSQEQLAVTVPKNYPLLPLTKYKASSAVN